MKLSDLPARDLARLDAVCLDFEGQLRQSTETFDPKTLIDQLVQRHGGTHASLLRAELVAIWLEVSGQLSSQSIDVAAVGDRVSEPAMAPQVPAEGSQPVEPRRGGLPAIGAQMGPYLITSVLGRGGMGVVYRATDTRLDRSVAIKMLAVDPKHASKLAERFQREAKAVAALSHPHIVELFDVGVYRNMPYAVMEHLRGETLAQRMSAKRVAVDPITAEMVRRWGFQLADALATAHAAGVIHRDLKPENVMLIGPVRPASVTPADAPPDLREGGKIRSLKLFDFGLSRVGGASAATAETEFDFADSSDRELPRPTEGDSNRAASDWGGSVSAEADSKTRAGMILGTPGYMAPEQARGEAISPAVDIFALGCVLYEAFFGKPAFAGESPARRYAAVLESQPAAHPPRRRDDVALADLILAMLDKHPERRPTAAEIATMLSLPAESPTGAAVPDKVSGKPIAREISTPLGWSRRQMLGVTGGGVAAVVAGMVWWRGGGGELRGIRSIGVLSLTSVVAESVTPGTAPLRSQSGQPSPVGDRQLLTGELLAGLLVNELSQLSGVSVPKYVPMVVSSRPDEYPEDYRRAAELLEVDALLTGTYAVVPAQPEWMDVNLQIISGRTGKVIDGFTVRAPAGENLIEQTTLAREVAQRVGQRLIDGERPPESDPAAFTCLVKGRTYADPDTEQGLRMAIACFKHALSLDPGYDEALAGLALTSITLAARTAGDETAELITEARQSANQSLDSSPGNPDARLAQAMLAYQTLATLDDIRAADATLQTLAAEVPNHYQVHQQLGWLRLMQLDEATALRELRLAAQLHPASSLLKTDLARVQWYRGFIDRAINEAAVLLPSSLPTPESLKRPEHRHPRGLLIDMYEHLGRLQEAADLDPEISWTATADPRSYFAARENRLAELPYGPFGPELNQAILDQRRKDRDSSESGERLLARLRVSQSPLLGLMLSKHPAFAPLAMLPSAAEILPLLRMSGPRLSRVAPDSPTGKGLK